MKQTLVMLAGVFLSTNLQASTWKIDPGHTSANFSVKHLMISKVRGAVAAKEGTLELNDKDITKSSVMTVFDVKTIDTAEAKRDEHLRSPDFFDVEKFPTMTFKSTKVEKAGKEKLKVTGDLTIRGNSKPVVLAVELSPTVKDPWGNTKRGSSATTRINRKDFGLTWNKALETGGVVVGEEVDITIDAQFAMEAAAPAKK